MTTIKQLLRISLFISLLVSLIIVNPKEAFAEEWPDEIQSSQSSENIDVIDFDNSTIINLEDEEPQYTREEKAFIAPQFTEHDELFPEVTVDDFLSHANKKGHQIIKLLQVIVQPLTTLVFILSALSMLGGALGNSKKVGEGLWGMAITVFVYAAVLYATPIITVFVSFLTT